jgi:hypothetical protein
MRILLAALVALTALAALPPTASASCLDSTPDDNGVGTTGCRLPVSNTPVPDCHVLVYGQLPGIGTGCSPIVCVKDCLPYDCVQDCDGTPSATATQSQALPCSTFFDAASLSASLTCPVSVCVVGPVIVAGEYDHALSCQSFIYCVTEPCPGSGRIEI